MNKCMLIFIVLLGSFISTPELGLSAVGYKANERLITKNNIERTVYVTKTGMKFHCQDCHYLKSCISIDKSEAIRLGYTPCKVCKP